MYTYYIEVESEQHYAYLDEIVEYLYAHGITSKEGKLPIGLTRAVLSWFHKDNPRMCFNTRRGLKRVFPLAGEAIDFIMSNCVQEEGALEVNGRKFNYRREKRGQEDVEGQSDSNIH